MAKSKSAEQKVPRANVAQLKARLSEYLRQVKAGAEITITERGVPVARLMPLSADERRATRRERLIRAGLVRPPQNPRTKLGPAKGRKGAGMSVLELLLAEREEGY